MLWQKNWLETRRRFFMALAICLFIVVVNVVSNAHGGRYMIVALQTTYGLITTVFLAGAGIDTQSSMRPERGLHGSTLFTLSMPVSRLRLLAVRSGVGLMEVFAAVTVASVALWTAFPVLRTQVPWHDALEYLLTLLVCVCAFYFLFVVYAALISDDLIRNWTCMATAFVLWWVSGKLHVRSDLNIFQAVGKASPLFTHTLPWASMGISVAASAIFFRIALKIVQAREY